MDCFSTKLWLRSLPLVCMFLVTVVSVCNSSSSNTADAVYIDMSGAPTQTTSTCYCTLTFERSGQNYVGLQLTTEKGESGSITLNINGVQFTARSISFDRTLISRLQMTITPDETPMRSCLRLQKATPATSPFKAACFSPGQVSGVTETVAENTDCDIGKLGDSDTGNSSGKIKIVPLVVGVGCGVLVVALGIVCMIKVYRQKQPAREDHPMTTI